MLRGQGEHFGLPECVGCLIVVASGRSVAISSAHMPMFIGCVIVGGAPGRPALSAATSSHVLISYEEPLTLYTEKAYRAGHIP